LAWLDPAGKWGDIVRIMANKLKGKNSFPGRFAEDFLGES
jgi:hypothetical protein